MSNKIIYPLKVESQPLWANVTKPIHAPNSGKDKRQWYSKHDPPGGSEGLKVAGAGQTPGRGIPWAA